ncbi:hypothetical protein R3I93_003488 [Phoxinus phoxinus]|uniref:Uncharacterized protein n=1 Tax=Phoxinus phoxinus TaxID=58324 RepID=A0AAN9DG51_9TELE
MVYIKIPRITILCTTTLQSGNILYLWRDVIGWQYTSIVNSSSGGVQAHIAPEQLQIKASSSSLDKTNNTQALHYIWIQNISHTETPSLVPRAQ